MRPDKQQVERIRKLRKLAASPNPHEAARARETADELMRQHGITEADIAELVLEVADTKRDPYRDLAAELAAKIHRCRVVTSNRQEIGFRGHADQVRRAVQFYRAAVGIAENTAMPPIADWIQSTARKWFDFCWWEAFAIAVNQRLQPPKQPREQSHEQPSATEPIVDVSGVTNIPQKEADLIVETRQVLDDLNPYLDVIWLRREATRAGEAAGKSIALDGSERTLPST
jgi:uncharacterized protein DUF2786